MITAIPMNNDRVANHFTKASCLVFLDERGVEVNRVENPAREAGCAGKKKMIDLLSEQKVNQVVVRNIGERMLGKLLTGQFAVYQTDCTTLSVSTLHDPLTNGLVQLHQASQGRPSLKHEAKNKSCGGCGAEGNVSEKPCCQSGIQPHEGKGHCCGS